MTQDNPFEGIERLDEITKDEILTNAQLQVDQVNADTKRAIELAKEAECSQKIAEEIAQAGPINSRQRHQIIQKWHRRFAVHNYSK